MWSCQRSSMDRSATWPSDAKHSRVALVYMLRFLFFNEEVVQWPVQFLFVVFVFYYYFVCLASWIWPASTSSVENQLQYHASARDPIGHLHNIFARSWFWQWRGGPVTARSLSTMRCTLEEPSSRSAGSHHQHHQCAQKGPSHIVSLSSSRWIYPKPCSLNSFKNSWVFANMTWFLHFNSSLRTSASFVSGLQPALNFAFWDLERKWLHNI